MKNMKKRLLGVALFSLLFTASVPSYVFATEAATQEAANQKPKTGTTLIAVSSGSIKVGETLSVTIRGSFSTTLTLKFNSSVLKYEGSSPSTSISDNVITYNGKEAVIRFTAIEAGSSGLILGGTNVEGCSTIIQVAAADGEEAQSSAEDDQQDSEEGSGEEPVHSTTFGTADRYISIMDPDTLPSDQLESRQLETTEGAVVDAYQLDSGSNEFYYMYGTDEKDNLGWFIYDSSEQTISRIDASLFSAVPVKEDPEPEKNPSEGTFDLGNISVRSMLADRKVWAILIFIGAALIALIVNLIVRRGSYVDERTVEESETNVSPVHRSYEDHESAAMIPVDTESVAVPPADPEENFGEEDDDKYNLPEDKGVSAADTVVTHEIIGEKRVDIMDLNDL